jgi:hypothetical protein
MVGAYIEYERKNKYNTGYLGKEKPAGIPYPKLLFCRIFFAGGYKVCNAGKKGSEKT